MPPELTPKTTMPPTPQHQPDGKALKILAKSIFRELKAQGYDPKQVVGLATELISLVTTDLQRE